MLTGRVVRPPTRARCGKAARRDLCGGTGVTRFPTATEGVAIHIGPKPCVGTREGDGEASVGERIGQPSSRESKIVPSADVVVITEGNTDGHVNASARPARRGRRPWHVRKLFAREPGGLGFGLWLDTTGPHREDEES
jgi:hypothetical protein